MRDQPASGKATSFYHELTALHSPARLEIRAENAFGVAVKFLELLEQHVEDPEERKRLMTTWVKAIRDKDFKKFLRAFRRYSKKEET